MGVGQVLEAHCPKNIINLCIKTELDRWQWCMFSYSFFIYLAKKPAIIHCCIRASRDRLGFNSEIKNILGQCYPTPSRGYTVEWTRGGRRGDHIAIRPKNALKSI